MTKKKQRKALKNKKKGVSTEKIPTSQIIRETSIKWITQTALHKISEYIIFNIPEIVTFIFNIFSRP